eukprot:g9343.t1
MRALQRRALRSLLRRGSERRATSVPFLDYANSARQDVAEIMHELEGSSAEQLHALSTMALDVWPSESPHWRLAGAVLPEKIQARRLQQDGTTGGPHLGECRSSRAMRR